jgi:uncharacterized protein (TIGR03067 family)
MKLRIPLFLALAFLLAADQPTSDANKKDLDRLQGDWAAVSMVYDGHQLPDDDAQSLFRTVKADHYTLFLFKKAIGKGTFMLDATKKPKTIDFLAASAAAKPVPIHGIYELDGDTWKVCYAAPGKERPKEFTAKEESGFTLAVWEREKK